MATILDSAVLEGLPYPCLELCDQNCLFNTRKAPKYKAWEDKICQEGAPWGSRDIKQHLPRILGHLRDKAKMTSGITQATMKISVIKVHPETADQRPAAGCDVISLQLLSCSAYDSDNFYFLLLLQSTHTHILLIVSMLHYPPLSPASLACMLSPRNCTTWPIWSTGHFGENSELRWSLDWIDKPSRTLCW